MIFEGNYSAPLVSDIPAIDYGTLTIFSWAAYAVVIQMVDVFGVGTNIINIVCFIKQGFREPVNISLLGKKKNKDNFSFDVWEEIKSFSYFLSLLLACHFILSSFLFCTSVK